MLISPGNEKKNKNYFEVAEFKTRKMFHAVTLFFLSFIVNPREKIYT